jgi:glycosyltransferase involved in cell wall biosynthesis
LLNAAQTKMISFIIPAYNEELLLPRTLKAIHSAARAVGADYEIVVVDDGSTDRTVEIAQQHGARVVEINKRQIAAARNAGAREAQGDVFIFVDADTIVPHPLLASALAALREGAVGGGCLVRLDGRVPLGARMILLGLTWIFRILKYAGGCFIFCRRDAFAQAGGFDERYFAGEELWFSRALKRQGRFVVLRESATTSGRKLRQNSTRHILGTLFRLAVRGPKAAQQRDGLELWYDGRR